MAVPSRTTSTGTLQAKAVTVTSFEKLRLAIKVFVDDVQRWDAHRAESEGLATWSRRLPQHLPGFFGRFVVSAACHDWQKHRLDTLLVGKVGPTLESVLTQSNQENEQHLKQQVQKQFLGVVHACERLHVAGLAFYKDLHMRNICLDEISQQYVFVDLEEFECVPAHLTFQQALKSLQVPSRPAAAVAESLPSVQDAGGGAHSEQMGRDQRRNPPSRAAAADAKLAAATTAVSTPQGVPTNVKKRAPQATSRLHTAAPQGSV